MARFLFGFRGRISRASFCLFAAIAFVAVLVLLSGLYFYEISVGNYENGGPTPAPSTPLEVAAAAAWFLCLFLIFVAALAVGAKRLHDRDKTAWWLVVFALLPNALYSLAQYWQENEMDRGSTLALAPRLAAIGIYLWAFVDLACLRGTSGANRFGKDPLTRSGYADQT